MTKGQENDIFDLIGRLIQTLSSSKISIDDRHTPKLYARFLAGLLSRHRRDGVTMGRLQPVPPPQFSLPENATTTGQSTLPMGSFAPSSASVSPVQEGSEQNQDFSQASVW